MGNGWERSLGSPGGWAGRGEGPAEHGNLDEEIEAQGAKALGL